MSAYRQAALIAKENGRGYHDVRIEINRLVGELGYSRFNAELIVLQAARAEGDLRIAVNAIIEGADRQ